MSCMVPSIYLHAGERRGGGVEGLFGGGTVRFGGF